jgi:SAM-dependent methyltransferase
VAPGLQDFIEWDLSNWSLALDFWMQSTSVDLANCLVLELGAGLGGLSLWLALKGARVVCTDLCGVSREARLLHRKYNVQDLIRYQAVDATSISYAEQFDLVIFKSVLGDIGRDGRKDMQESAMREIHKALKPNGELWFAENLVGSPLHSFARRFVKRGTLWRYVSTAEVKTFLSSFRYYSYRTTGFSGVFGRREPLRKLLGTLDRLMLNRIVPERWRYVVIAIAKK